MNARRLKVGRLLLIAATSAAVCAGLPCASLAKTIPQILKDSKSGLVYLKSTVTLPSGEVVESSGTGFLIGSGGYVLTASHVLSRKGTYDKYEIFGSRTTRYGEPWPLDVIKDLQDQDLLLLKFKDVGVSWQSLQVRDPSQIEGGAALVVLGFPLTYDLSVKRGEFSNPNGPGGSWITSVLLNHGDSGAPVLDEEGRVIAIVVGGDANAAGISFCIPINHGAELLKIAGVEMVAVPAEPWAKAPIQIRPPDGAVFANFPRSLKLAWSPVAGAEQYQVDVQIQELLDSSWHPHPFGFGNRRVRTPHLDFTFVGSQPGRWRVTAIDSTGKLGTQSPWSYFEFQDRAAAIFEASDLPFVPKVSLEYSYSNNGARCNGYFFGDGLGAWIEKTSGANGCLETQYNFQQDSRTAQAVRLFDADRGYYLNLPTAGGWAQLATSPGGPFTNLHRVERLDK